MDIQTYKPTKAEYRLREIFRNIPVAELTPTKSKIAFRLGISIAQLNRIIRGESDPNGTQLLIIAESFNMKVDDLYYSPENTRQNKTAPRQTSPGA